MEQVPGRSLTVERTLPSLRPLGVPLVRVAGEAFAVLFIVVLLTYYLPDANGRDALQWYRAEMNPGLYVVSRVDAYGFVYSPTWALAMQPLQWLPPQAFLLLFVVAGMAALWWLVGPWWSVLLLAGQFPLLWDELRNVNINLLVAVVAWAGIRYPFLWALPLLTKVTPGVGLLWFVARGEWRQLLVAVGVTLAIAFPSMVLFPELWRDWFGVLTSNVEVADEAKLVPLWIRWPLAAGFVVWGARTDRAWTVPLAVILAAATISTMPWLTALGAVGYLRERLDAQQRDPEVRGRARLDT